MKSKGINNWILKVMMVEVMVVRLWMWGLGDRRGGVDRSGGHDDDLMGRGRSLMGMLYQREDQCQDKRDQL